MKHAVAAVAAGIVSGGGAAITARCLAPGRPGLATVAGLSLGAAAVAVAVAPGLRPPVRPTLTS